MDEEPSTSYGIKRHIPPELQNEIDEIAAKRPREEANPSDLDDDQKRWLVVGICLHTVLSPALRKYVDSILTVFHNELIRSDKIDTQIYTNHLRRDPQTGILLNYEAVNKNKANYGKNKAMFDYTIKNAVDLSKLFLQTHMVHYTGFDETCDSSALLGLILNIAKFDPVIKSDAKDVRTNIRNPWAHCNFTQWDTVKCLNSFQWMTKLVKDLKLSLNDENLIVEEFQKWEINGQRFLSGTTHGLELVNEFRQQTHVLAEYAKLVAKETDDNFMRIKKELEKFQTTFDEIAQLDKDTKERFTEVNKKLLSQDKTLIKHGTQIEKLKDVIKCACHDSHNADIEFWKEKEVIFVETPVVKVISQILESNSTILIVGEPGIGKSMLMHHIALKLHDTIEYNIIPCYEIQDILRHYKEDTRQMFVLDDICGRFTISSCDTEYLLKNEDILKRMLEKGKTKIAATCRLDIYNDEKFHASCSVFTSSIFDLSTQYSKEDKLQICTKYLNKTNIQLLRDQNEPFTPLMCYLYSKNENFNLTDFFHCPYETYRNEWKKLQSIDPYKYCALFLFVIHNSIIQESIFDIYNENFNINEKVFKKVFDICGINQGTSLSAMKKVLDRIIGTYLRKTKNEYRVIHDHMFDFMCCYFGNNDTLVRCLLRYADIKVFNERTQLESINEQYCKFAVIIPRKYEQDYFERIKDDLQLGKLTQCFSNVQMKHENYRASFLKVLKSIDAVYIIDHQTIQENMITSCSEGYYKIVEYFVSKRVDLDKGYQHTTPLICACRKENEKIVQLLIDNGCDVNQVNDKKDTPLIAAYQSGNEKIVQILLDKGVDVNQYDGNYYTPLAAACGRGNEKLIHLLIDKGCDVNQVFCMIETPLTAAFKNTNLVQLLIDRGCDVNKDNGAGETPLTAACLRDNIKIVQLLIDKGSDLNQVDRAGKTPLTTACRIGHQKIVQLLINEGCDVNQVKGNVTPLVAACLGGNETIVRLLIDKGGDVNLVKGTGTPLLAACKRGNEQIIKLLLDKGCDVNQVYDKRQTPLTAVCERGTENVVQLLIDKGIDVNQVDGMGRTPLTTACRLGKDKIVQLLIDKGCDVNKVNDKRQTPMTAACEKGNEMIVQLLIDKKVDVNKVICMRETPLTAACSGGHEKTVQLLIDKGSDVNLVDGMRRTPLTAACNEGNEKIVQLLIAKGGDISQVNGISETSLTAACKEENEKIVRLLIEKGSAVNQVGDQGNTPLTAARIMGNTNI